MSTSIIIIIIISRSLHFLFDGGNGSSLSDDLWLSRCSSGANEFLRDEQCLDTRGTFVGIESGLLRGRARTLDTRSRKFVNPADRIIRESRAQGRADAIPGTGLALSRRERDLGSHGAPFSLLKGAPRTTMHTLAAQITGRYSFDIRRTGCRLHTLLRALRAIRYD